MEDDLPPSLRDSEDLPPSLQASEDLPPSLQASDDVPPSVREAQPAERSAGLGDVAKKVLRGADRAMTAVSPINYRLAKFAVKQTVDTAKDIYGRDYKPEPVTRPVMDEPGLLDVTIPDAANAVYAAKIGKYVGEMGAVGLGELAQSRRMPPTPKSPELPRPFDAETTAVDAMPGTKLKPEVPVKPAKGERIFERGQDLPPSLRTQAGMPSEASLAGDSTRPSMTSDTSVPRRSQDLVSGDQSSAIQTGPSSTTRPTASPPSDAGPATTLDPTLGSIHRSSTRKITQKATDVNALLNQAQTKKPEFEANLRAIAESVPGSKFNGARVKDANRAMQKASRRPAETIPDYLGGRISVDTEEAAQQVIDRLSKSGRIIDDDGSFAARPGGYIGRHIQVDLGDGMSAEVQIMPHEIAEAHSAAHAQYKVFRSPSVSAEEGRAALARSEEIMQSAKERYLARTSVGQAAEPAAAGQVEDLFPKQPTGEEGAIRLGQDRAPGEPTLTTELKREYYDRFEPIKYKPGEESSPEFPDAGGKYTDAYIGARTLSGKIKARGQGLLKDLNDAVLPLKDHGDRDALNRIYSMRNFADLHDLRKTTSGVTRKLAEAELDRLKATLGEERFTRISKVADAIADIQNNKALDLLVEGKVITPESAQILRERYPNYLRSEILEDQLRSEYPEFTSKDNGEPIGRINRTFLKTKQGSEKAINTDVLDVVRRSLLVKAAAAEKQKVVDQIVSQFGKEIGSTVFKEGQAITTVDAKKIPMGYVRSGVKASGGKIYAVRQDIENMLQGLNRQQMDLVTRTMSRYNRVFKAGATTYRATFVFSNLFRDAQELLFKSRSVFGQANKAVSYGKALVSSIKEATGIPDKTFEKWLNGGGSYGGIVTSIPRDVPIPTRLLSGKDKTVRIIGNVLAIPFDAVRIPAEILENTSRLAEYIRLKDTELPEALKILNSRDITVDFDKVGDSLRIWNNIIPFLNPQVQGAVNIARAFRDQPWISAGKLTAYIALPAIGLYAWNRQYKNDDLIDPYIKDNFWYINTGATRTVDGQKLPIIWHIRKGETAQLFSNPIQSLLEYASKDPNFQTRLDNFTPTGIAGSVAGSLLPPALKEPFEQSANFDTFHQGPIVPERLKDVATKYQFTQGTTDTARRLGEKTGLSPVRVEHAMKGIFPASKQFLEMSDSIFQPRPEIPRPKKKLFEASQSFQPLIGTPSGNFSQVGAQARRFENANRESGRTPAFMLGQAYAQYLRNQTPENLKTLQDWSAKTPPEQRVRAMQTARKQFVNQQLTPEERARRSIPLKRRGRFSASMED